jgi:pimeloyl-ACP methyl ester carboxylesterase
VAASDGVRLHVESTGDGPAIVFAHEFGGDTTSWEHQVAGLSNRYRCVAFNARGYPPSDVPEAPDAYSLQHARDDLLAILDALSIERASLVGLSMGSFTCLHAALAEPARIDALVVAGTGYGSAPAELESFRAAMRRNADDIEANGMAWFANAYGHDPARVQLATKDPRAFEAQRDRLARHSVRGSASTMRGVQARRPSLFELTPELEALPVRTLIVCGDEDAAAIEGSRLLDRTIPSSRLVMLPGQGHLMNLEDPDGFNRLLADFLEG